MYVETLNPAFEPIVIAKPDLTDRLRANHTAEWRVKLAFAGLTPLEREMLVEWLGIASQVARERLLASGIQRIREFMAVDPNAVTRPRLQMTPPRPAAAKPLSAADILGD